MGTDVLGYLSSKGLQIRRADKRNVNVPCWYCGEADGKRGRLYVNVDEDADIPGLHFCHLCGTKGSLKSIQRFFGDDTSTGTDRGVIHYDVLNAAALFYHKNLNHHPEAVTYFEVDRGLTRETIRKYRLGWADGDVLPHLRKLGHTDDVIREAGFIIGRENHEFYQGVYTIPYYVGPTCVGIRQKDPEGKYKQPSGYSQRPFGTDNIKDAEQVVITEGEFDCMVAEQLGYTAVGCPGASGWQETWNEYLRDAKRVWVVFDNDKGGRDGAERIRAMVGPRCRAITIPPTPGGDQDDKNDISDWVVKQGHTKDDFEGLLNKNKGTLLITVAEAMDEWAAVQGMEGIKFNIRALDTLLYPGLLPGQVVITLAKTNTGKTLWLENTMELMAQGDPELKFLFMSLEQTRGEWFERAHRIHAFYQPNIWPDTDDEAAIEAFSKRARQVAFEWWDPRFMMTDKNRMTQDHIRVTLDDYALEHGVLPDVVCIDYLGYLARGFPGSGKYETTSEAVMVVKEVAKDYGVTILTPHQVNRGATDGQKIGIDTARDSGAIEETGDFVFVLYDPDVGKKDEDPSKTGMIHMHIGKSRHGGKGKEIRYGFGRRTLVMVPEGREAEATLAVREERFTSGHWQHALFRHRHGLR